MLYSIGFELGPQHLGLKRNLKVIKACASLVSVLYRSVSQHSRPSAISYLSQPLSGRGQFVKLLLHAVTLSILIFLLRTVMLFGKGDLTSLLYVDDVVMATSLRSRDCLSSEPQHAGRKVTPKSGDRWNKLRCQFTKCGTLNMTWAYRSLHRPWTSYFPAETCLGYRNVSVWISSLIYIISSCEPLLKELSRFKEDILISETNTHLSSSLLYFFKEKKIKFPCPALLYPQEKIQRKNFQLLLSSTTTS